jgi:hypothetical protein
VRFDAGLALAAVILVGGRLPVLDTVRDPPSVFCEGAVGYSLRAMVRNRFGPRFAAFPAAAQVVDVPVGGHAMYGDVGVDLAPLHCDEFSLSA